MRVMKFPNYLTWCLSASLSLTPVPGFGAEEDPVLSAGFVLFGDLYYVPNHHTEEGDGAAGGVLRRAYLTFNANLPAEWFGRVRFEANQSGDFEDYDIHAEFKDLYIGRNFGRHRFQAGLSPNPLYDVSEAAWGMRYIERTPLDLQGIGTRETGLSLRGPIDAEGTWTYRGMVDFGTDFGKDSNPNEKWMGGVSWKPEPHWTFDLYADHDERDGPKDRTLFQAFAAYTTDDLRWGVLYGYQDRQDDPPLELASGYFVKRTSEKTSMVLRVDRLIEPSPSGDNIDWLPFDPAAPATMLIAGLEFRAHEKFFIAPNTAVIYYDQDDLGQRADTDVLLRLTLFLNFE